MGDREYQASESVLTRVRDVHFVAVVGPSGVGKTTLINRAIRQNPDLHLILSDTTRPPRPGECDGVDYNFRSQQDMRHSRDNREFVNIAPSINGVDVYGTHVTSLPDQGIGMMAVLAEAIEELRGLPFASFRVVCIVPSDYRLWQSRMVAHGFSPEQFEKRMGEARRSLEWMATAHDVLFVVNDDIDRATEDFIAMSTGAAMTRRQQTDQFRNHEIIASLLAEL